MTAMSAPLLVLEQICKRFGAIGVARLLRAAPDGIWAMVVAWFGWQLFPLERTVLSEEPRQR
jgi:hypothetical protein